MIAARRSLSRWVRGVAALAVAACAGSQPVPAGAGGGAREPSAPASQRTAIEVRRDAACEGLGPRITACAVEDARADLAAGKVEKAQFDRDTAPEVQHKHTEAFEAACKATAYSSRQIRVLEVCLGAESACGPLLDCLGHLTDQGATNHRGAK